MIRSLTGKIVTITVKNGQFFIRPAKKAYISYKQSVPRNTYNAWVVENETRCYVQGGLSAKPLISVVVPAYNPEPSHYLSMIYSVVNQHYENWELVIVNASDDKASKNQIATSQDIDTRIKVVTPSKNEGIAGNTNFGLKHCTGSYVAFLDHDDLLHECALHSIVASVEATGAGVIYTDEDKIKADGSFCYEPFFKPRWSPDLFENVNYINHLTAVKKEHIDEVKGLRTKLDGAQDYDFLLRLIDVCKPKIEHVSRVLYHWRAAETSTASDFSIKSYVLRAGEKALEDHLARRGIKGTAKAIENMPGFYRTLPRTPDKISIVVGPTDPDNRRLCAVWLHELSKYLPDNISAELIADKWLEAFKLERSFSGIRYVSADKEDYWRGAGQAVATDVVLCFSIAALPDDKKAISELAAQASLADNIVSPFVVGGKMILDAGLVESDHGKQRLFTGCQTGDSTYYGYTGFVRNVAGLTLDIFATSRANFRKLTEDKQDTILTDMDLDKIKTDETRLIINPRAPFNFKGALTWDKFFNDQYFNPQLTQAHTDLYVKVSSWGNLKEMSERDNAG